MPGLGVGIKIQRWINIFPAFKKLQSSKETVKSKAKNWIIKLLSDAEDEQN